MSMLFFPLTLTAMSLACDDVASSMPRYAVHFILFVINSTKSCIVISLYVDFHKLAVEMYTARFYCIYLYKPIFGLVSFLLFVLQ